MDRRNDPDSPHTSGASRSPWGAGAADAPPSRPRDPWNAAWRRRSGESPDAPAPTGSVPLSTPLVWVWGGVLLTLTMWLSSMVALFRSFGSLFH